MKSNLLNSLILAALVLPSVAMAAETSPISANVSMTTDYIFRGISQSSKGPAMQGGFDYAHASGLYVGTWGSSVGWIKDFQGYTSGSMEFDLYAGFRSGFEGTDVTYDLGAAQYMYPGSRLAATTNADTTEVYGALGWKWLTAKYSRVASSGAYGFANASGSDYMDLSASVPLGETGLTAGAHWGTFKFKNNTLQNYTDTKLSLSYDIGGGLSAGVAYTNTDAKKANWSDANAKDLGAGKGFAWITKAF